MSSGLTSLQDPRLFSLDSGAPLSSEIYHDDQARDLELAEQKIKYLKEKLDSENELIKELVESVNQLEILTQPDQGSRDNTPAEDFELQRQAKESLPDETLLDYLHKLHASSVPSHRHELLTEMSTTYNITCNQLGLLLLQLRYLAEKVAAARLFCPLIYDPENLEQLVSGIEQDPYQDDIIIKTIINNLAGRL